MITAVQGKNSIIEFPEFYSNKRGDTMAYNSDYQTELIENLAKEIIQKCGVNCHRNNVKDPLAVDICTKDNIKIDVQYSNNYAKYGDFRLDIISAYTPKNALPNRSYKYNPSINIISNFKEKYNCNISKVGKLFQENYLDYFIILFYNTKYTNQNPDFILLISKEDLINYCKPQVANLFSQIKTNNKKDIGSVDQHGSAFVPLNVTDLCYSTNCIFGSYEEFLTKKEQVRQYLFS